MGRGRPLVGGREIYHVAGSPAEPDRLRASQSTGWFGQLIQRSDDGGRTWEAVGNDFRYHGVPGTHQWYDGPPHPWEFARVWHLEARYPQSRGTIRDPVTRDRRPFVRFFAGEQDLSHQPPPDAALPDVVATGTEPVMSSRFMSLGQMAGG